MPFFVKPPAAERVDERTDVGHVLSPARLAPKANAIYAIVPVSQFVGKSLDLFVGGLVGHLQALCREQILAIERHRTFRIEWKRIEFIVIGQTISHGLEQVIEVI